MSKNTKLLRQSLDHATDSLEMVAFNDGFEAATFGLDEMSDQKHNAGDSVAAEILRWAAKELRGENAESIR